MSSENTKTDTSVAPKPTQLKIADAAVYGGTGATIEEATKAAKSETTAAEHVRNAQGCDFKFTPQQQKVIAAAWTKWLNDIRQYHKQYLPRQPCPAVKSVSKDAMIVDSFGAQLRGRVVWFEDGQALPFVFPDSCQEVKSAAAPSSAPQVDDGKKKPATAENGAGSGGSASPEAIPPTNQPNNANNNVGVDPKEVHSAEAARKRLAEKLAQDRADKQTQKVKELVAELRRSKTAADPLDYKQLNCGFAISREDGTSDPIVPGTRVGFTAAFVNGARMICSYAHWQGDEKKPLFERLQRAHGANTLRVFFVPNPKVPIDERAMFVFVAQAKNQTETNVRRFLLARCKNPAQMPGTIWLHTVIGLEARKTLSEQDRELVEEKAHKMNWDGYADTPYMWNRGGHYENLKETSLPFKMEASDLSRAIDAAKKPKKSKLERELAKSNELLKKCTVPVSKEDSDAREQLVNSILQTQPSAATAVESAAAAVTAPTLPPTAPPSTDVQIQPMPVKVKPENGTGASIESVTDGVPVIAWSTSR